VGIQDQVTHPFADRIPQPGEAIDVAPGIWWIRMPLPFALDHINLWILEDGDGFTLVDTGYGVEATWSLWERHFAGVMAGRAVKNVVVTHYHPDHVGAAGWLVERTGAPFWMTTSEYLSAHAAHGDAAGFDRDNTVSLYVANGVDPASVPESTRKVNGYRRGVPTLPRRYRRMMHGDRLAIGATSGRSSPSSGTPPSTPRSGAHRRTC
jgi:glyoxylase-like metal-dependent hydrolase (beta-lactamase superfamily II)